MSRVPVLQMLPGDAVVAAAARILRHPTANVQRVAMNETYSLAIAVIALDALADIAARTVTGDARPGELAQALAAAGYLPAPTIEQRS